MKLKIGQIVAYSVTAAEAEMIMRRRTNGGSIAERIEQGTWPLGAQAHIGREVSEGDRFPAVCVREGAPAGLRVMLDGTDDFWVETARHSPTRENGHWSWLT